MNLTKLKHRLRHWFIHTSKWNTQTRDIFLLLWFLLWIMLIAQPFSEVSEHSYFYWVLGWVVILALPIALPIVRWLNKYRLAALKIELEEGE